MPEIIAVLCSDLHLSHRPPIARSAESDWYEAMARPLRELEELQETDNGCVPIICAGDVFDKWNSLPELINFALEHLPEMYAIPGQHDLPYHGIEEIEKSAFWTLVEAKKVYPLGVWEAGDRWNLDGLCLWGFPWGVKLLGLEERNPVDSVHMAVVHKYCWTGENHYEGGNLKEHKVDCLAKQLKGYDIALFGDNHNGFKWFDDVTLPTVFNAGTFMRRTSPEKDCRPMVGLLYEDGTVEKHYLDMSKDKFIDDSVSAEAEQTMLHLEGFLEGLKGLGEAGLDFEKAMESTLVECGASKAVRRVVLEAMEGEK